MEETNKETGNINEKPLDQLESFTENMAPPRLPLGGSGSSSFEVVKKPYLNNFFNSTNDEGKLKGRDASPPPSDYIIPGSSNGGGDLNINGPMNSGKVMTTNGVQFKPGHDKVNIDMDRLKKQKRRILNQESAQRCRMRNAQYIEDLQQKVRDLQGRNPI
ncbi:hypothetical protein TIFTF001_000200 [Ficus carica]|uniref:BZIP domain-containing protein n=1 Tax=Ficus carica TaxID=3494 RepID=A0AA87YU70_FICCA|nr:hypothetical protein TIFTF001_000200 [Ficus carica]